MSISKTTRNDAGIPTRKIEFTNDKKSPTKWNLTLNLHTEEIYVEIHLQNDFVELTGKGKDSGAKISIFVVNRGEASVKNIEQCKFIQIAHDTYDLWFPSAYRYMS